MSSKPFTVWRDGARMRRVVEEHRRAVAVATSSRCAVGSPSVDHQHHRLRVGVTAQVPPGQRQRVVQVGALLVNAFQRGQFGGVDTVRA